MDARQGHLAVVTMAVLAIVIGAALTYIGFFATTSIKSSVGTVLTPTAASGTLTFTGDIGCGERVNITSHSGVLVPFIFNTSIGCHEGVLPQNGNSINITFVGLGSNTSVYGATNLSGYINANATLTAEMTASNVTNETVVTYSTTGTAGNDVTTSETLTNGTWTSTTLTGGVAGETAYADIVSNVNVAFVLTGILIMLMGAGGLITVLFSTLGRSGNR